MDKLYRIINYLYGAIVDFPAWVRGREQEHVENHYITGPLIGRGSYGSVYAGMRISDGLPVALKYVGKLEGDELLLPGQDSPIPREVALMGLVNQDTGHRNVLHLHEWFDASDHYVMVLERPYPCTDLLEFCDAQNNWVDEEQARGVMDQLLQALLHCQNSGVFHRDVKAENILINTESLRIILIDFGCGDLWQDTPFSEFSGTREYAPPECFVEGLYQAGPSTVWSVGVTLYDIICGRLPFKKFDEQSMSRVRFPEGLSSEIKDFIRWCLAPEVEDRATLEQLQLHPWLRPFCSEQAEDDLEHVEDLYMIGSLLGEGGCGSVYAGIRISDGLPVALKYVEKCEDDELLILPGLDSPAPLEVGLMGMVNKRTGHPNVLRLHEWFNTSDHYVLVLERPDPCTDLFRLTQNHGMDEEQARVVMDQLLRALLHCQSSGVFHRDVKPENILIVKPENIHTESLRIILIDFGCGAVWQDTPFSEFAGTEEYAAPECLVEGLYQAGPSTVWTVGATLCYIICGRLPFDQRDERSMSRVDFPDGLSSEVKDFIGLCLAPKVEDRATLEQLQLHPWLRPICSGEVESMEENGNEEDGEQNMGPMEKPGPSSSLTPANCSQNASEESGKRERDVRGRRCAANPKTPADCLRNAPEKIAVKRKMGCEENQDPYSSSRPTKCPRKEQDGWWLKQQDSEAESQHEHGHQAAVLSPGRGAQRGAQHPPPPHPEQGEDGRRLSRAESSCFRCSLPAPDSSDSRVPGPGCLPLDQPAGLTVTHFMLGFSMHWNMSFPEYDQMDGLPGLAVDHQGQEPSLLRGLIKLGSGRL
ncbi:serine/threonine-protein kinase PkaA-like [Anguilla anguilla]|uniref:serine/threonine-protein kinase PkaA-like n=1 Tax=Anguilla anguilla TaxID=7936 RepID=UPI0015B1E8E4|nr:serine/threonine-protein kinase PkaA-like [Anguilla anguilla]